MVKLPYLPLYVRDFLSDPDVRMMRWIDQALYLRMLMASWEAGPLPDSDEMIARLIGAKYLEFEIPALAGVEDPLVSFDVRGAVRGILECVWEKTEAGWVSQRLEHEREYAESVKAKQSAGGAEGNQRRWSHHPSVTDRSPIGHRSVSESVSDRNPQAQSQSQSESQAQSESQRQDTPPSPPKGGKRLSKSSPMPEIPERLRGDPFPERWAMFLAHRSHGGSKLTPEAARLALQECERIGLARAVAAIENTVRNGWKGLREPQQNGHGANGQPQQTDVWGRVILKVPQ